MSAKGGGILFQEKVAKLLSRRNGKPALKHGQPLVLRDYVANRKPKKGEATCITEMSVLMACWKQNNFVEDLCSPELNTFYSCVEKAKAAVKAKSSLQGGELSPKEATTLLKRFPNPITEI